MGALALGLASHVNILRSVRGRLGGDPFEVAHVVKPAAHGDLQLAVKTWSDDASGALHSTQSMIARLSQVVSQVSAAARNVA